MESDLDIRMERVLIEMTDNGMGKEFVNHHVFVIQNYHPIAYVIQPEDQMNVKKLTQV